MCMITAVLGFCLQKIAKLKHFGVRLYRGCTRRSERHSTDIIEKTYGERVPTVAKFSLVCIVVYKPSSTYEIAVIVRLVEA